MNDKKIEQHKFEKGLKELRGSLPDSLHDKIKKLGHDEEGSFVGFTKKDLKKQAEYWKKNPSHGMQDHANKVEEAFGEHF